MRQVTATEKYRAVNEGKMAKKEFVRQMRQAFPNLISQFDGFDSSVQILKNRGMIFEAAKPAFSGVKVYDDRPALTYSLDALDRGIRVELGVLGIDPATHSIKKEDLDKATKKAKDNLEKDANHYLNLMAGESNKVDKHDKEKEVKRGALDKDTFNDMKKATLKESIFDTPRMGGIHNSKGVAGHTPNTHKQDKEYADSNRRANKKDDKTEMSEDAKKNLLGKVVGALRTKYPEITAGIVKDFIKTHYQDLLDGADIEGEFEEYIYANYETASDMREGDKGVEGDIPFYNSSKKEFPYLADYPVDQAFKKAGVDMSKPVTITQVNVHGHDQEEDSQEHDATKAASVLEVRRKKGIAQALKDYGKEWDDLSQTSPGVMPDYSFDEAGYDEIPDGHDFKLVIEYEEGDYVIVSQNSTVSEKKVNEDIDSFSDVIQVVGVETVEDAIEVIEKYEREFNDGPVSVDQAKELVADLRATDEDEHDKNITNLVVKAFNIKLKGVSEKKGKDHDGDGDIDGDDYKAAKDKAIKKAMGKEEQLKEAIKSIIKKTLNEDVINEAATSRLSQKMEDFGGYNGAQNVINSLENIVTEVESFYGKVREKIQKVYDDMGNIENEEGLKIGQFIGPAIESAFMQDLRPVTKKGFTQDLQLPKAKQIDPEMLAQARAAGEVDEAPEDPKATVFTPNF